MTNLLVSDLETTVRSESISELLDKLTKESTIHIGAEEQLLEEFGYSDFTLQKEEHKACRIKIVVLCQASFNHKDSFLQHFFFLRDCWVKHILETDEISFLPHIVWRQIGWTNIVFIGQFRQRQPIDGDLARATS